MTATLTRVEPYQATRLVLPDALDYDAWREQGLALQQMAVSIQWWVGDWYLAGEHQFGEKAAAAVAEACGWAEHTVQNAAWVAGKIPPTSRRQELSWSHHAELAALGQDDREDWLDKTQDAGWTRAELRRELGKARALAEPAHRHKWRCLCGDEIAE